MITVETTRHETETQDLDDYLRYGGSIERLTSDPEEQALLRAYASDHATLTYQRDQLCALKPHLTTSYEAQYRAATARLDAALKEEIGTRIFHLED